MNVTVEVNTDVTAIKCDRDGCAHAIHVVGQLLDENKACGLARHAGWYVRRGATRDYHYCPTHREDKR
jgi:hypothetical protein